MLSQCQRMNLKNLLKVINLERIIMKKIKLLYIFVFILVFFVACKADNSNNASHDSLEKKAPDFTQESSTNENKIYISVISKGWEHEFWQAFEKGCYQAATDYSVDLSFQGPARETDAEEQLDMLKLSLAKKPSAICLAAIDSKMCEPCIEEAYQKEIPIIAFDSGVDSDLITSLVTTNDFAAAKDLAEKMAEQINYQGEVGIITFSESISTRSDGFIEKMNKDYPEIKIVDLACADGNILRSTLAVKKMLLEHPNIKGIFATNEGSAVGAVNAISELKKADSVVLLGFDSGGLQIDAIKRGVELGAISQDPYSIGYKTVEAAIKAINGEVLDSVIYTKYYWYDKNNIDDQHIKSLLYY